MLGGASAIWGCLGECGGAHDRVCVSFYGHVLTKKHTSKHTTVMTTTRPKIDATTTKSYSIHTNTHMQHDEHVWGQACVFWGVEGGDGGCTHQKGEQDHGGWVNVGRPSPSSKQ